MNPRVQSIVFIVILMCSLLGCAVMGTGLVYAETACSVTQEECAERARWMVFSGVAVLAMVCCVFGLFVVFNSPFNSRENASELQPINTS